MFTIALGLSLAGACKKSDDGAGKPGGPARYKLALIALEQFLECPGLVNAYNQRGKVKGGGRRRNVLSAGPDRWRMRGREETITLPPWLSATVRARFEEANRALAHATGLDLGSHGYL